MASCITFTPEDLTSRGLLPGTMRSRGISHVATQYLSTKSFKLAGTRARATTSCVDFAPIFAKSTPDSDSRTGPALTVGSGSVVSNVPSDMSGFPTFASAVLGIWGSSHTSIWNRRSI